MPEDESDGGQRDYRKIQGRVKLSKRMPGKLILRLMDERKVQATK